MTEITAIHVSQAGDYDVVVGRGFLLDVDVLLARLDGAQQLLVVHQPALEMVAHQIRESLSGRVNVLLA